MTLRTNARIAGITFLTYIAFGMTSLYLSGKIIAGAEGTASTLTNISRHESMMQVTVLLTLIQAACALVLAVSIYALTRDRDRDLARMAMFCRIAEGVIIVAAPLITLSLLSVATTTASGSAANATGQNPLGDLILKVEGSSGLIAAICFSTGSMIYCYLFLRARSIPVWLAWLGLIASVLLVVVLPLQLAGFIEGPLTVYVWLPMLVFELVFAIWLIIKGIIVTAKRAD
jgi:hypothetical protein